MTLSTTAQKVMRNMVFQPENWTTLDFRLNGRVYRVDLDPWLDDLMNSGVLDPKLPGPVPGLSDDQILVQIREVFGAENVEDITDRSTN